jgi:hypothetical protein
MKFKLILSNEATGEVLDTYRIVTEKNELKGGDEACNELTIEELCVPAGSLYLAQIILQEVKVAARLK